MSNQKVDVSELIDLIDQQDKVSANSKSALKKRLETYERSTKNLKTHSKHTQEKLEKEAAYDLANTEISKWQETVSSNRSAAQLDLTRDQVPLPTLEAIASAPSDNPLRGQIDKALGVSQEVEVIDNSKERAKNRSDMFHQYLKQKRTAKIKSKLYHKIKKKQKLRNQVPLDEEELKDKEEKLRIQERITLKHTKSKFKQSVLRYAKNDKDKRNELLAQNEALKQRILNTSKLNSEGALTFGSSSEDEELLVESLENKGILGMKFMQNSTKREREEEVPEPESRFKFSGQEQPNKKPKQQNPKQQELINQAFELDEMEEIDQVAAEEWAKEEEEKQLKEPKPKAGWGSWAGAGIQPLQTQTGPKVFKTNKVILNQERDKRAAQYYVKEVPFPYRNAKQYEAVHRIPVGKEWNSRRVHQQLTAPEVVTRRGEIIVPISTEQRTN